MSKLFCYVLYWGFLVERRSTFEQTSGKESDEDLYDKGDNQNIRSVIITKFIFIHINSSISNNSV